MKEKKRNRNKKKPRGNLFFVTLGIAGSIDYF